jgi:hypothetical protein
LRFDSLADGRQVVWVGNEHLQIAMAHGGGHIVALRFPGMAESANPFWQPPWTSLEPESVTAAIVDRDYGGAPEGRLLASILGHSLALDLYGPASREETSAGGVTHGKAGVLPWEWKSSGPAALLGECQDTFAKLHFSRQFLLKGTCALIEERVDNLCGWDRPIGWQQHVSLGPPFILEGFWARSNCDLGGTHPHDFGAGSHLVPGAEARWPFAPRRDGGACDYRIPLSRDITANDFSGFQVSPRDEYGAFVAGNTQFGFAIFYLWPRHFFPWMGVWDEQNARQANPWAKRTSVRAYEFGVSPFPLSRRDMLATPSFLNQPTYLMLPGSGTLWVRYVLGIFPQAPEAGDLTVSGDSAALITAGREIAQVVLPGKCESSKRTEME